jgi:hypothetical protein
MRAIADPQLALVRDEVPQTTEGCAECLRLCLTCGHPGCRDSPPLRPARVAARPIVRSFEPGESRR